MYFEDGVNHFDGVIVANGHHWDCRWAGPYPGDFTGEVRFKNKKNLFVFMSFNGKKGENIFIYKIIVEGRNTYLMPGYSFKAVQESRNT